VRLYVVARIPPPAPEFYIGALGKGEGARGAMRLTGTKANNDPPLFKSRKYSRKMDAGV
jgi:hypothetical protein